LSILRHDHKPVIFLINDGGYTIERGYPGKTEPCDDIANWPCADLSKCVRGSESIREGCKMQATPGISASSKRWSISGALIVASLQLVLTSCSSGGAPSFTLFGAFFPAWMLCGLMGIFGAVAARSAFAGSGLSGVVPYQLLVCTAIGVIVAILAWFALFWR